MDAQAQSHETQSAMPAIPLPGALPSGASASLYYPRELRECPTGQAYDELQHAYNFFNARFFGAQLPPCLITLQRNKRSRGYFCPERFVNRLGVRTAEIALNPAVFATSAVEEVLSTLVSKMVHHWQHFTGEPSRRSYHDKAWAEKMKEIGLQPSDTGFPGGKTTGEKMSFYIIDQGPFIVACRELLAIRPGIIWFDRQVVRGDYAAPGAGDLEGTPRDPDEEEDDLPDPVQFGASHDSPDAQVALPHSAPSLASLTVHAVAEPDSRDPHDAEASDAAAVPAQHGSGLIDGDVAPDAAQTKAPAPPPPSVAALSAPPIADTAAIEVVDRKATNKSNRLKYRCSGCKAQIWGKPGLQVSCIPCSITFEQAD